MSEVGLFIDKKWLLVLNQLEYAARKAEEM